MNILNELRTRFQAALAGFCDDPASFAWMVKPAQDTRFGDYQANCAMSLARQKGVKPPELAKQIVDRLEVSDLCEAPTIAGPGFINLRLRNDWLRGQMQQLIGDERLGVLPAAQPRRIVVDYSSPNVAKPMHVGHLRSSVIGDAVCRILRFAGHAVTSDNHIGDWGTQFGMLIYGYKHFLDREAYDRGAVGELARLYRLVNQLSDYHDSIKRLPELHDALAAARTTHDETATLPAVSDKALDETRKKSLRKLAVRVAEFEQLVAAADQTIAAVESDETLRSLAGAHRQIAVASREETAKLHAGDAANLALWQQFMPACLAAMQTIYDRLNIKFDLVLGESFYQPFLAEVVANLEQQQIATTSNGAVCVFIPGFEAPFIVKKTDGAYTYATTDLATIRYRVETLSADTMLYVVDARQGDHFKLLFETARKWGYDGVDFRHISFGTVLGDDNRPFKTRSGDTVGLESLLDESIVRARAIVDANDDRKAGGAELDAGERAKIAETVGIGAIKYADLCQNRESDYVFSWDKMLAKTGDTATYMQYAFARVCGIFRKGGIDRAALRQARGEIELATPSERALALQLARFSEVVDQAAAECRPNVLTHYLFETANSFSTFFEHCPVLKAETDASRTSRLLLADLTARVVKQGLELLGIRTIEQM
ncbi:MAG: arginine--tRNA ligase [Planctomycetaceae bacterium]|nr:arginine--tRNA ligase [Planctomycetaceae bacterium]